MDKFGEATLESMSEAGWYNRWSLDQFREDIKGEILEVGCGVGNFTSVLTAFGKVTAIDVNKNYIEKTKDKSKDALVGFGDIEKGKFFFKDRKFDTIICINVLEHIKDDKKALENLKNLLISDGQLIIIVPSHQALYGEIDKSIDHYRRYDKKKLEDLINRMGLSIIKSKRMNFIGAIGWFLAGRILKNNVVQKDKIHVFNIIGPFFLFLEKFISPPLGISILIIAKKI